MHNTDSYETSAREVGDSYRFGFAITNGSSQISAAVLVLDTRIAMELNSGATSSLEANGRRLSHDVDRLNDGSN